MGIYWDSGKENGNYYSIIGYIRAILEGNTGLLQGRSMWFRVSRNEESYATRRSSPWKILTSSVAGAEAQANERKQVLS